VSSALEIDEGNLHIRGASGRIYFEDGPTDPYYYLAAYKTATAAGMRLKGYAEVRLATGGPDGHDVLNVIGDKVGIGTDNPDSALEIKGGNLHIRGASGRIYFENGPTDPYYYLAAYQTATAAGMRLKGYAEVRLATGGPDGPDVLNVIGDKVGIGTGSPQGSLHIYSPDNPTTLRIQSSRGFGSGKLEFWSDPQGSQYEWRPAAIRSTDNGNFTGGLSFVVNGNGWGNRTGEIEVMRLVNGSVGIGTSHPEEKLEVNGSMKVHGDIICDGTIFAKPPSKPSDKHPGYHGLYEDTNPSFGEDHYGMWHWPSDQRLKRAVSTIPNALAILKQLRGVNFLWNDTALEYFTRNIEKNVKSVSGKPDDNKRIWEDERKAAYASLSKQEMGFVAQEVEKVFPNWVSTDTQGYKRINMARLNAVMVNAIKEQQDEIEAQQKEISELKAAHNRAAANWEARLKKLEETVASNKPK